MKNILTVNKAISVVLLVFLMTISNTAIFSLEKENNSKSDSGNKTLFQGATVTTVLSQDYDGQFTVDQLKKYGNLAVGVFHAYDGELIAVDGEFYKIKAEDGKAYKMPGNEKVFFVTLANFKPDATHTLNKKLSLEQLKLHLDSLIPSTDQFYAFRLKGHFKYVKARSVSKQQKPYPHIRQIIQGHTVYEFKDVEGELVAFRYPFKTRNLYPPGYHFHFITKDKTGGGHALEFFTSKKGVNIEIDHLSEIKLIQPQKKQGN
jgi:acetolactate decarboxylase